MLHGKYFGVHSGVCGPSVKVDVGNDEELGHINTKVADEPFGRDS